MVTLCMPVAECKAGSSSRQPDSGNKGTQAKGRLGFMMMTNRVCGIQEEDAGMSLNDFFRKTKAKPALYWLPAPEDKVAEKKAEATKASLPAPTGIPAHRR